MQFLADESCDFAVVRALLEEKIAARGIRAGTVDRFQRQKVPVVIYSMTTSTPADAPRGMDFLYSLSRLNVATSRARCASILVASPALLTPTAAPPTRCAWPTPSADTSNSRALRVPRSRMQGAATQRFLYRPSTSRHADRFILRYAVG